MQKQTFDDAAKIRDPAKAKRQPRSNRTGERRRQSF
jgi:hypothetical protein